jgi:hypothetical protein
MEFGHLHCRRDRIATDFQNQSRRAAKVTNPQPWLYAALRRSNPGSALRYIKEQLDAHI